MTILKRKNVKDLCAALAMLLGLGLLLEGAVQAGNGVYLIAFLVTGISWATMSINDKHSQRKAAVAKTFGIPEEELRSIYSLSEADVTLLLENEEARREFSRRAQLALNEIVKIVNVKA